jgi:sec-independent protein translocase protein TatA
MMPGPMELCIIGLIIMLLFGAKRLPQIARALGSSATEFKKGVRGIEDEVEDIKKTATDAFDVNRKD